MKKSQLIMHVILTANPSFDYSQAIRLFVHEFVQHFSDRLFYEWDLEVSPHVARAYLDTVDTGKSGNVQYLVNELDKLFEKMK